MSQSRDFTSDFDHTDPNFGDALYDTIDTLLDRCPIAHGSAHGGFTVASRYDDVRRILRDYDVYSSANGITLPSFGNPPSKPLECDPPEAQAFRGFLLPYFNPTAISGYRPWIREIADELLLPFRDADTMDFAREFALPFPALVTCRLLDLPMDNWRALVDWFIRCFQHQDEEALEAFMLLLKEQIQLRRGGDGTDLLSVVANAVIDGELLDIETATSTGLLLCAAGLDTTTNTLAQLLRLIGSDPSLRSAVTEGPDVLGRAIEETLRLHPPLHGVSRTTTRDVDIEGVHLDPGDRMAVFISAANRDPRKFANPSHFDVNRRPNQHLAFGHGLHLCLGNHLARAEIGAGIEAVMDFAPGFELAGTPKIEQRGFMRSVTSLPVCLNREARSPQPTHTEGIRR